VAGATCDMLGFQETPQTAALPCKSANPQMA
jgi:hypothetical protein